MAKALVTAEEHGALPEILRGEYGAKPIDAEGTPTHGMFRLNVDPVHGLELEDVGKLKTTVSASRSDQDVLKADLGRAKSELEKSLARITELEAIDPESESDKLAQQKSDSTIKQMKEQHATALQAEQEKSAKLLGGLERALIRSEAITAIADQKGAPNLLLDTIMGQCKLAEKELEDGEIEYVAVVLDAARNTRIGDAGGTNMTIAQLVAEMKADPNYSRAFDGTGESGAAKKTDVGRRTTPKPEPGDRTPAQKVQDGLNARRAAQGRQ